MFSTSEWCEVCPLMCFSVFFVLIDYIAASKHILSNANSNSLVSLKKVINNMNIK